MAISPFKTWLAGEILTASDLNSSFSQIINNGLSLISPLSGALDLDGNDLIGDADGDSKVTFSTNNRMDVVLQGEPLFYFDGTTTSPVNGVTFAAKAAGSGPTILALGSDTDVPITLGGQGAGAVLLGQATSAGVKLVADQPLLDSAGNELLKFTKTASAVNEITVANAATGTAVQIQATGGDTDVSINIVPKGAGSLLINGVALSPATTGDAKLTLKTTADTGWVMMDDGTIGDASSGASNRANADTAALFALLWNNTTNANCAVSTGRGATAAADFAAHKTIALPKVLGRALAVAGAGSGLTSRALAATTGAETHAISSGELPSITPGGTITSSNGSTDFLTSGGSNASLASPASGANVGDGAPTLVMNSFGGGSAMTLMQPTSFLNVMVKL